MNGSSGSPVQAARYKAFISYSHAVDGELAPALQRGLHRLAKSWYRAPVFQVFRDDTSLSATPALWSSIEQALIDSEFFILLASPRAAESEWVHREIIWWLAHKPRQRLLIVLTDGAMKWDEAAGDFDWTVSTALSPSLQGVFADEPRWVDLRWARTVEQVSLRHPRFRDAVADLAAPLHGVAKEQLVGEDVRQQRLTVRWRNSAIAALVILSLLTGVSSVQFFLQRNLARDQRDLAISRQLAAQSSRIVDTRPEAAILVGLESLRVASAQNPQPPVGLITGLARLNHVSNRYSSPSTSISVAFNPDGRLLAFGDESGSVQIWNVAAKRPEGERLIGHTSAVQGVAFSPNGQMLASTGDMNIHLWDVTTGRPHGRPLSGHTGKGNGVAFSPDGRLIASAAADKTVRLWNAATGQPYGEPLIGHSDSVFDVTFSPDGKLIASAAADKTVRLWNAATGQPYGEPLIGHTEGINALAFSPDNKVLVSASLDKTVRLWQVATGTPYREPLIGHTNTVNDVAFSSDGQLLASADGDVVRLWDANTGRPHGLPLSGHTDSIRSVAFNSDGKLLATVSDDKTMRLWDVVSTHSISHPLTGHTAEVFDVAFSPDGKLLASAGGDATVRLWDAATGQPRGEPLTGHTDWVLSVAFNPDGTLLASAGVDGTLRLWDVSTSRPYGQPLSGHTSWVTRVAFSPDGKLLASASNDKTVQLWEISSLRPHGPRLTHSRGVLGVAFSPDGKLLASADTVVRLWDVSSGRSIGQPLSGGGEVANAVAFSPSGKLLASADGAVIRLWDVASGRLLRKPLAGHTGTVNDIVFNAQGTLLASSGIDSTVRLWEVPSGHPHGPPLTGHFATANSVDGYAGTIEQIAFSSDGTLLASAGDDTTVRLWKPDFTSWVAYGCRIVNRNLSMAEWEELIQGLEYERTCPNLPSGEGAPADAPAAHY